MENLISEYNYDLEMILSVYSRKAHDGINLKYYIENHPVILKDKKVVRLCEGVPLSEQTMFSLGSFLKSRDQNIKMRRGLLPENLLYIDSAHQKYVWFKPAHKGNILFDDKSDKLPPSGKYYYPNLLFMATTNNIWVLVYKPTEYKPGLKTKLYKAPLPNLYEEGNMCKGSIQVDHINKTETHQEFIDAWEDAFFNSYFSSGLGLKSTFKKEVELNRKKGKFDYTPLKHSVTTLEKLIS